MEGSLGLHLDRVVVSEHSVHNILSARQLMGPGKPFRGDIDGEVIRITHRESRKLLATAHHFGGLWFVDLEELFHGLSIDIPELPIDEENYIFYPQGNISRFSIDADHAAYAHALPVNRALMYHLSNGHPSMKALYESYKNGKIIIDGPVIPREHFVAAGEHCRICAMAKSAKKNTRKSKRKVDLPYQLLSLDLCEPGETGIYGADYFAVLVDFKTRIYWIFLLKTKGDIYDALSNWFEKHFARDKGKLLEIELKTMEKLENDGIGIFRTDGGGELGSHKMKAMLNKYRVQDRQTGVPYSHSDNALAERAIKELCLRARAILIQYNEPKHPELWEIALVEACRTRNRLPCSALPDHMTPYEAMYGHPPNLTASRPHGAICYAVRVIGEGSTRSKNPNIPTLSKSAKFDSRVFRCKFLGFPVGQKGYRCLLIDAKYRDRVRIAVFKTVYFDCRRLGSDRIPCAISGSMGSRLKVASDEFVKSHPDLIGKDLDGKSLLQIFLKSFASKEGEEALIESFAARPPVPVVGKCVEKDREGKKCTTKRGCYECRKALVVYRKTYKLRPVPGCSKCRWGASKCKTCDANIRLWDENNPDYVEEKEIKIEPGVENPIETALDYLALKDIENEVENAPSADTNDLERNDIALQLTEKLHKYPDIDIVNAFVPRYGSIPHIVMPGSENQMGVPIMIPRDVSEQVMKTLSRIRNHRALVDSCGGLIDIAKNDDAFDEANLAIEDINFRHVQAEPYRTVLRTDHDFKKRFERFRGGIPNNKVRRRFVERAVEGALLKEKPEDVILITDDEGHKYFVQTPSADFVRVFGIAEGKRPGEDGALSTFSHIEYLNTMTLGNVQYDARFTPTRGAEALKSKEWREKAMMPEMGSLHKMGCFQIVPRTDVPKGQKLISG